jgi:hypothetical protein
MNSKQSFMVQMEKSKSFVCFEKVNIR